MKTITTLVFLFFFLQSNAQDSRVYTESGTSFFFQIGTANNLYSELIEIGATASFFNDAQASKVDKSVSVGVGLEIIRANVGFRLQTNRIKIHETFEISSSTLDNNFGQFQSANSSISRGEQINYEIVPGIHRYFQANKWVFSGGLEIPFTIYDVYTFTQDTNSEFISNSSNFSFTQILTDEGISEMPGGYDVGIGVNLGLQYEVNSTLKLGVQYASSVRHYKIGGESEFLRKSEQIFTEQFEDEAPMTSNVNSIISVTSTNTHSKIADFRQKMNFALVFSF